ncbi:hypothetical protein FNF27_01522 [Cafeteria roenbergensis]|uniref:Uncharacterized protein n=1 Tax=Cafeteria roenbergensis TaxID=33653 RepID=A0A5A8EGZ7_CAFRO|nr:hypothetical protein FNF27_01522 [Cafeteria roenbergensis]
MSAASRASAAAAVAAPADVVRRAVAESASTDPAEQTREVARACAAALTDGGWETSHVEEMIALLRVEMGEERANECADQVLRELQAYSEAVKATLPLLAAVAAIRPQSPAADEAATDPP